MYQYKPGSLVDNTLEVGMYVGTAECTQVTDSFCTLEDAGPMTANQLQVLLDGGWSIATIPLLFNTGHAEFYIYNFKREVS